MANWKSEVETHEQMRALKESRIKIYYTELMCFFKNKRFWLSVFFTLLLSYAYATFNETISIDDLETERYVGSGNAMLASGRFGVWLWSVIVGQNVGADVSDLVAMAMLIFACINVSILLRRISHEKLSMGACTVFTCVFLSYPLHNEIWEYTGTNKVIGGNFLLASFALLLIHDVLHKGNKKGAKLIISVFFLTIVCAGYESVAVLYVFLVFAILAFQVIYTDEKTLKEILRQGIVYAALLLAGVLLRVVVHKTILLVTGWEAATNGATAIYWLRWESSLVIKRLILGFIDNYILRGIVYFPISELLVAIAVFVVIGVGVCRKNRVVLLPGLGMLFSLILMSLIQGGVSPYRTCQIFALFVAFTAMVLIHVVQAYPWKRFSWMKALAWMMLIVLCYQQCMYTNRFLTANHLRSEEEAFVVRTIGTELEANYDKNKPVIFVGSYELSDYIVESVSVPEHSFWWRLYRWSYRNVHNLLEGEADTSTLLRKLPDTNVNSMLEWGEYGAKQEAMKNIFAYYGFDYVLADYDAIYEDACTYVEQTQMPIYPQRGYIQDMGSYILVRLGEIR